MNWDDLQLMIAEGEGLTVEFKEKYTPRIDRDIVAFSNTKGRNSFSFDGDSSNESF